MKRNFVLPPGVVGDYLRGDSVAEMFIRAACARFSLAVSDRPRRANARHKHRPKGKR